MPSPHCKTLDLSLLQGITAYIEAVLLIDVRKAFDKGQGLQPFGIALGTITNGKKLPRPQVMAVGSNGMGLRNTKRTLRTMAKNSAATGIILLQLATVERVKGTREDEVVLVQLEHKEFGDLVWTAAVTYGGLAEFEGPLPISQGIYDVKRTGMLPERWMH